MNDRDSQNNVGRPSKAVLDSDGLGRPSYSMRDSQTHSWSEADVDSLLTDFFRAEMPAELRRLPQSRVSYDGLPRPSQKAFDGDDGLGRPSYGSNRERRAAGFKGLGAAACALLLAVMALSTTGRHLVSPKSDHPTTTPTQPAEMVKKSTDTKDAVIAKKPPTTLPPELMKLLPPELRSPADNASPVLGGDGDPLDLRELLRIEVFEPRDGSKPPRRIPERRPRLPEER
jgi:hypothetical protein